MWPDYWDASISVMHVNSDPVVALLSPDTVQGGRNCTAQGGGGLSDKHVFGSAPRFK